MSLLTVDRRKISSITKVIDVGPSVIFISDGVSNEKLLIHRFSPVDGFLLSVTNTDSFLEERNDRR